MRRWIIVLALAVLAALTLLWVWETGFGDRVAVWAAEGQREVQNAMARGLRGLRSGQPGAFTGLISVCFAYGFFHAVGPGHGKMLVGGYGLGSQVPLRRLSLIAVAASLGQGLTAIALVAVGMSVFAWSRTEITGLADRHLADVSYLAIGLIGAWLMVRGARHLWAERRVAVAQPAHASHHDDHDHHHHHDHGDHCGCGHAHAPDPAAVAAMRNWRDGLALVGAVAMRPCTGALFLLILTWQMGLIAAGVAGVLAMSLGTASVTLAAAWAAVGARRGVLSGLSGGAGARIVLPCLEILAGALVIYAAATLLMAAPVMR